LYFPPCEVIFSLIILHQRRRKIKWFFAFSGRFRITFSAAPKKANFLPLLLTVATKEYII